MAEEKVMLLNPRSVLQMEDSDSVTQPTTEQFLSEMDEEELASVVRIPSVDSKIFETSNKFKLFGEAFSDSLLQQTLDTPATMAILIGREWQEQGKDSGERLVRVGESIRNVSLAIRQKLSLTSQDRETPETFSDKLVSGLGSGSGSMLSMILASLGGGLVGSVAFSAAMGPQMAPVGAAVGSTSAAFLTSFYTEKALMAAELMDAGYGPRFSNVVSDSYAVPVALLDVASFKFLGKLLRPSAASAVKTSTQKFIACIGISILEGAISEGGTEAIQQRLQTETEVLTGIRSRDFLNDLTDDAVAFIVGSLMGSAAGTVGQLKVRKQTIDRVVGVTGLPRKTVASMVDDAFLQANSDIYDMLAQYFDVTEEVQWIDRAFKKIEGVDILSSNTEPEILEMVLEMIQKYQELYDAVQVDEKAGKITQELEKAYTERFNARDLEGFEDTFYRGGGEGTMPEGTAADVIKYEQEELGNKDVVVEKGVELSEIDARNLEWVTETEDSASRYGEVTKKTFKSGQYRVIARDNDGGVLIEKISEAQRFIRRDEAAKKLMQVKKEYKDFIAGNEYLQALVAKLDDLQARWEKATPEEKTLIEEEMQEISFRMRNPGEASEVVKIAEEEVNALERQATDLLEQIQIAQDLGAENIEALEKEFSKVVSKYFAAERRFQGYQSVANRVRFGEDLTVAEVRRVARQHLKQVLETYKIGRKFSELDLKNIQKAFRVLLSGQKLSGRAATRLLRSVLSIRTATQFNEKIGSVISSVNEVIKSEKVRQYQDLGLRILKRMLPRQQKGEVAPAEQMFAQHLNRVLRKKADLVYQVGGADLDYQLVESAVYDLANAESDEFAAEHAVSVLSQFYKDRLSLYKGFREAQIQEEVRIAEQLKENILQGVPFDELAAAYDSARQKDKRDVSFGLTPLDTSIVSLFDILDAPEKMKLGQGTLGKVFDPNKPYLAMVTLRGQVREKLDGQLFAIYGKDAQQEWVNARANDFLEIQFTGASQKISRAEAMSLWLMTKMPGVYNELLRQDIDPGWLAAFERGDNVAFTKQDYDFMSSMRELLDWFAERIAPVYERVTHRPFRRVDEYFLTSRFFVDSLADSGYTMNNSIIDAMLNGDFAEHAPDDIDSLKQRVKRSDRKYQVPDIFEAMSSYSMDMTHFIAYAEYVTRLQHVFKNSEIRQIMLDRTRPAYLALIDDYVELLTTGFRDSDRIGMQLFNKFLGTYARNQVATPKSCLRQISGVAAAMDLEGCGPVELVKAIADLPRAIKSGELKNITDTKYMQERYKGMYDIAVLFIREQAKKGSFKGDVSQRLHDLFTIMPRYGDLLASVLTGWMVYRHQMTKTNNPVQSSMAAIRAIDDTQQSMNHGKVPMIYNKPGVLNRLFIIFQRQVGIFLDRYLRAWRGFLKGQVSKREWIRTMLTYHIWIPLVETLITAGRFERDETLFNMAMGPLGYYLIIGQCLRSIAAGVAEGITGGAADLPAFLKDQADTTLVGSFTRQVLQAGREAARLLSYPDYEYMWQTVRAGAKVAEAFQPLPTGWLIKVPEAIYELLQGTPDDIIKGAKRLAGWTDARLAD